MNYNLIIHYFHSFVKITVKIYQNYAIFTIIILWKRYMQTIFNFSFCIVYRWKLSYFPCFRATINRTIAEKFNLLKKDSLLIILNPLSSNILVIVLVEDGHFQPCFKTPWIASPGNLIHSSNPLSFKTRCAS